MADRPDPLSPGLRAPDFVLPTTDGTPTRFYGAAGGTPLVLVFRDDGHIAVHDVEAPDTEPLLTFVDGDHEVRGRFGADPGTAVILDPNLRVLGTTSTDSEVLTDRVHALTGKLPVHDDVQVSAQAPVLLVPDVLTPTRCDWLIQLWADSGAEETGVETTTEQTRAEVRNVKAKRRRDLTVTDQQVGGQIAQMVGQAIMPEIRRAFHYRASRFEGFKIGCYDEDSQGFFSAHRDNLSPATAHRRFALSLNLNSDYDGGEIRFPEFGPMRYRPPAGGALIFSGALLHEVLPVTRARRFVLLSFLWGDDVKRPAPSG